jgi:hypothetical protein
MTLAIAWIRAVGANTELVFASDSRLTGGRNIDHFQKVFSLPREDRCIAFSGSTSIAYPFSRLSYLLTYAAFVTWRTTPGVIRTISPRDTPVAWR